TFLSSGRVTPASWDKSTANRCSGKSSGCPFFEAKSWAATRASRVFTVRRSRHMALLSRAKVTITTKPPSGDRSGRGDGGHLRHGSFDLIWKTGWGFGGDD